METLVSDDQITVSARQIEAARHPETTASVTHAVPMTGSEFIESLRDGREVFIYGERVKDVTVHPASRACMTRFTIRNGRTGSSRRPTREMAALRTPISKHRRRSLTCCRVDRRSRNGRA
jgi:hypothetical protein